MSRGIAATRLEKAKAEIGSRNFAAQYQQNSMVKADSLTQHGAS